MKVLRTAAIIVGAVALVATGIGAVVGAGTFLGVAGSTFAAVGTIAGAASAVLGVAANLLTAKPPGSLAVGNPEDFKLDPQAPVPYVIGETATGGYIADREAFGVTTDDVHNPYQSFACVWSLGPIEGIEAFQVDRVTVPFSGTAATGSYAGYMWLDKQLGACPESNALSFSPTPPQWGASYKLSGLAAGLWTLKFDKKGKKFAGGLPAPQAILKGVKAYDPRLDSTYPGGEGSCRAGEESTYVYTENPWLHLLTVALGRWQNGVRVFGVGMALASISIPQIVEAANIADANGWKAGGVVTSADAKWDVLKMLAQAGGGEPIRQGAKLSAMVSAPRVSLATITSKDLVGKGSVVATQSRRERINGVVPRIRLESHGWEVVPLDAVRVEEYVTADKGRRTREIDYQLVQQADQAAELAAYDIVNAREFGPVTLPLKTRWMGYRPGDCLTLDIPELGLSSQAAIITRRSLDPATGVVTLELKSETPGKHDYALGRTGTPPPTPSLAVPDLSDVAAPDATDWTLTGESVASDGGSLPVIAFSGSVANPNASAVVFEYRASGNTEWISAGTEEPETTRKIVATVAPGIEYEGAVSYRVRGVVGARLILGPVTSGNLDGGGNHNWFQDEQPPDEQVTIGDWWLTSAGLLYHYLGAGEPETFVMDGEEILFDGAAMTWADPGGWVLSSLSQKIDLAGGNTYFPASSTPPTAGKVGDFWFDTSAGVLKRWDGTAWIGDGPDKTDQVVATMPAIDEIKVYANYQGAVNGGQLPRTIYVPRYRGGENVSSTTTYGLTVPAGVTAAIDDTADSETRGTITLTALSVASAALSVSSLRDGVTLYQDIQITRIDGEAPASGGGGGAGAPVTDTTIEGIGTATTFTRIAGPIKVTVGTSGEVELAMQASYRVTGGDEFISIRADAKLRSSADGSTSWTDVAGSNAAVVDGWAYLHITPPKGWREQQGSVSINVTADSLPPGSYWFDVVARVASGDGSIDSFAGSFTARPL